ncbi:MAG: hypothetical protein ACOZNI_32330 [Myxococcota bacterium]
MKRHLVLIGLVVAVTCIAAWIYVPEFRDGVKLLLGDAVRWAG